MMNGCRWTWLAAAMTAALAGCASPYQYTTVRSAVPDPVVGQKQFVVAATVYAPDFVVGEEPESEYLARKSEAQRAEWQEDKAGFDAQFRAALASDAASHGIVTTAGVAPFTLHPVVHQLEPGYNVGISSAPAQAKITIELRGPDGSELDEILIDKAAGVGFTVHARIGYSGMFCGKVAARYLAVRTASAK